MLSRRLASAAIIISLLIGIISADFYLGREEVLGRPGLILSIIAVLIGVLASYELVLLLKEIQDDLKIFPRVIIGGVAVAICSAPVLWRDYPPDCPVGFFGWSMMALTFAIGTTFLIEIINFSNDGRATSRVALSTLIFAQVILLCAFLIAHRLFLRDNSIGLLALITLISAVKMSDAAAYFTGKTFGKNKLAPVLSPGKTIEGAVGSVFGATIGAAIPIYLVAPFIFKVDLAIPIWWLVVYSLSVTVAGIVGDLSESMLKRDAQIKDSSSWLPGLGGILDVVDSLVFAAPLSYFLWVMTS